jgi:hypothetical protein
MESEQKIIACAFEAQSMRIPLEAIERIRPIAPRIRRSLKYCQIAASIREVGIIEPPVVARKRGATDRYLLLDGHLRLDVMKAMGATDVVCLIATETESFTYNKRISRLATVQEHHMVMTALAKGVSEERLAKALNLTVMSVRQKQRMLNGICPEAIEILKDKQVPVNAFTEFRRMKPLRQIEAANLMVTMNRFTTSYVQAILASTPESQLVERKSPEQTKALTDDQIALMERESASLDTELKSIERTFGSDNLALVIGTGFIVRLLASAAVVRHLAAKQPELLAEFQRIADSVEAVAA